MSEAYVTPKPEEVAAILPEMRSLVLEFVVYTQTTEDFAEVLAPTGVPELVLAGGIATIAKAFSGKHVALVAFGAWLERRAQKKQPRIEGASYDL